MSRLDYKINLIANRLKVRSNSQAPAWKFNDEARRIIIRGDELLYLSRKELKDVDRMSDREAAELLSKEA